MEQTGEHLTPREPPVTLAERARQALVDGDASDDAERLRLLEELYENLERELDRDVGETASTRR